MSDIPKLKDYEPTPLMEPDSYYDEAAADFAVDFIQQLCHTKGRWAGKPFELIDWQERIVRDIFGIKKWDGYRQFKTAFVEIPKKMGKELALSTLLPTPDGFKTMGDIQVGDTLFDENGCQCHVVAKSEVDDTEQAYRLTFRDGSSIVAGERHLWDVEYIRSKPKPMELTTGEIYERTTKYREKTEGNKSEQMRSIIRIPVCRPLQCDEAELPVDPYLYGYWLGNGCATSAEVTVRDEDVDEFLSYVPYPMASMITQPGSKRIRFRELKPVLVGSFRDKVIRPEYLRASERQRWALLQGLIDSDGSIGERKGQSTYVSTVRQLADSVRELLWSLGIKNAMHAAPSRRYGAPTGETLYTIRFTTFDDQPTSRLRRKIGRKRERKGKTRSCCHYLKDIEPIPEKVKMQCVQVDSASHQYLVGASMVPTHNSELAAAIALLLLCGDGEQGAEIYSCAADRQQAKIVYDVAKVMVQYSPALSKRIKILDSTKRMEYFPTNSVYQVLSADAATKHGLNSSGVIFDELHAQPNRNLYDVMTQGAGDARTQPLFFLITTAGNNTHSVCYEVHQKALDILDGRKHDPTFYPVIYGADMDDDWSDPKVWAKANPSMGVTVTLETIRDAYESARQNPGEENAFRQLRLNQWVKQSVRWMQMDKWDACSFPVDTNELEGRVCYGGLDLSSKSDITAFVLVFPPRTDDEKYVVLPFFWLPEEAIPLRVKRDHVPYDVWAREGLFCTTEGDVIHYAFIRQKINELNERYHIKEVVYDRWGATQIAQDLEDDGFTVVPFGQGFKSMSPPTKQLMDLVLERRIAHGGDPVLRWMMDNVMIKTDPAGNIKMDKEKSTEKIDGAVAMVMGLDRAIRCGSDDGASVYDTRGLLVL